MVLNPAYALIGTPPAAFNLAEYVLAAGAVTPEKPALKLVGGDTPEVWRYGTLAAAVAGTAAGLRARGLKPGDRVLLRLGNTPDFPIAFLGSIYAGLVPIPTSAQLTAPEVTAIASETSPAAVIAAPGIALPDDPPDVILPETFARFRSLPGIAPDRGPPDRPAYILYTSGTSGTPRAVVHAHRAIWARRMMWQGWYGLRPDDVMLHAGAFNWSFTLGTGLLDPWAIGATALIPAEGTPRAALPDLLAQQNATLFAAAPGNFRRLLRQSLPPLPHLRHALSAGEKLPPHIAAAWQAATGTPVLEAYGLSECSTFISSAPDRQSEALGWPQPGRRITLRDRGLPVPDGAIGTIAIHKDDPGLMLGYLNAPEETAARFDGEWFLTGDLGRVLPDGAIDYAGRSDDMMNAGGYRVSPVEVENALATCPGITEVAAVELRVAADTTIIAAFYTGPAKLDPADVSAFAARRLAGYKVPRQLIRVPQLPRGTNNKLLRQQLRRDWETAHGQT